MIGRILQAVIDECKALPIDGVGTIILKTDYRSSNLESYAMPLLLLDLMEAPESGQYIGALTRMDYIFALNSYNYEPNSGCDPDGGYSTSLLNIIDTIRRHFSYGVWITSEMTDILNSYGFRFTLGGLTPADPLEADGLIMGYKVVFDSISFDVETNDVAPSTAVLEDVIDLNGHRIS